MAIFDMRTTAAEEKQGKISNLIAILQDGESFLIVDDQSPTEMIESLIQQSNKKVAFETLESGPPLWRVRVSFRQDIANSCGGCCGFCGGE